MKQKYKCTECETEFYVYDFVYNQTHNKIYTVCDPCLRRISRAYENKKITGFLKKYELTKILEQI